MIGVILGRRLIERGKAVSGKVRGGAEHSAFCKERDWMLQFRNHEDYKDGVGDDSSFGEAPSDENGPNQE